MSQGSQPLRAEHVAATRAAIVEAATALFGARGYASTSIDDVAAAARVTKGAVYHHFESKQSLFRAVYEAVERRAQAPTPATKAATTPLELIRRSAAAYLDATLDPVVQRITLVEAPAVLGPDPDGPAEQQPGHAALRDLVAAAIADGKLAPLDPDAVASMVRGACLQAALVIASSPRPRAARRKVGAVLDALLDGLAATGDGRSPRS